MSIKSRGGIFGRNPTFNDVEVEGDLAIGGSLLVSGETFSGLDFEGNWDANTNDPDLTALTPTVGQFWIVSTAGTTNIGGFTNWSAGDWALYDGSDWQRVEGGTVDLTNSVTGALPIANGGTNATTASAARTSLGSGTVGDNLFTAATASAAQQAMDVEVGVDVQAYDATILNSSDIGSQVQAYDAGLQSISGLTTAADKMIYTTASDTYAVADLSSAGRALIDDADAAAQRTTLGLGSAATTASTDYATAAQGTLADSAVQPADLPTGTAPSSWQEIYNPYQTSSFTHTATTTTFDVLRVNSLASWPISFTLVVTMVDTGSPQGGGICKYNVSGFDYVGGPGLVSNVVQEQAYGNWTNIGGAPVTVSVSGTISGDDIIYTLSVTCAANLGTISTRVDIFDLVNPNGLTLTYYP